MLYSEARERKNRFIAALKIGFPFLILTLYGIYVFSVSQNSFFNFFLLVILIPIYVYYILYMIYVGFKTTLIDSTTKTFTRQEIQKCIKEYKKRYPDSTIALINVENVVDINERYGMSNADNILEEFTKRLDQFLTKHNFKDIPIGRFGGGHFLIVTEGFYKELGHILGIFERELKNKGIDNIEVKMSFALLENSYDPSINNCIKKLFSLLDEQKEYEKETLNIKPNDFEWIIKEAIDEEKILFKYQAVKAFKTDNIEILEVLPKIESKTYGILSRIQIQKIVNYLGYETLFDKKIFTLLLRQVQNCTCNPKPLFSIKISAVSLRNNEFREFLKDIFEKSLLQPSNFILEFSEKRAYQEMQRFSEILLQYKQMGFFIALDNFGGQNEGYEYIKHLPIDIVKFDLEFSKNINKENYKKMLYMYIKMLKDLDIKVMIKFVDKNSMYDLLREFGVDFVQGFIVAKPKNLNNIEKFVKENNEIR